jgi:hypothetical protein
MICESTFGLSHTAGKRIRVMRRENRSSRHVEPGKRNKLSRVNPEDDDPVRMPALKLASDPLTGTVIE